MENKKWYQSKTIRVGILTALTGLVTVFISQYPDVGLLITLKGILDVALRLQTTTPIE